MSEEERRDKRFPSPGLRVRCESWSDFVQYYATDVSQGGMFIATSEPPPLLAEIDVQIQLPEGHEVQLKASVVHVIDAGQAARENKQAGVGVHFLELERVHKEQMHQLVEFARWEGASGQAKSTLASRMFEVAASIPPSKVMDQLPPEPEHGSRSPRPPSSAPGPRRTGSAPPAMLPSRRTAREGELDGQGARTSSGGVEASGGGNSADPAAPDAPPKSVADPALIKLGMTHLARRRYDQAISTFEQAMKEAPADREALGWLHRSRAQLAQKQGQGQVAVAHYQKLLELDESNAEARKFVREYHHKQRLTALPFGRYFVKKP